VREDTYYRHEKTFHRLCVVNPFESDERLRTIYDRHVALLHDREDPFRGAFVEEAARRSQGKVGVFLRFLQDAFTRIPPARRSEASVEGLIGEWWAASLRDEPVLGPAVLQAIQTRGGELKGDLASRLRASALRRFMIEDVTAENALSVDPIALSVLRKKLSRLSGFQWITRSGRWAGSSRGTPQLCSGSARRSPSG
jgi:hypothetical protein